MSPILIILFFCLSIAVLNMGFELKNNKETIRELREKYKKLLSQKKSSEVVTGQIAEQLAPFLKQFPYDPKTVQFLGMPIDYIVFNDDGVTLVEVKSGNARLSKKQRGIRDHVKAGNVFWNEIRIK